MPDPVTALIAGGTTILGGAVGARGARKAGDAQVQAAEMGVEEQRAARLATEKLMAPYVQAGTGSLQGQQALLGLLGPEAQQQAYAGIELSPMFQSMVQQGESGILANASATGGLRGGNIQAALGQFRPQMLQSMIQNQYQNLAGLTSLGQRLLLVRLDMVSRRRQTLVTFTVRWVKLGLALHWVRLRLGVTY
jgi:hypothetical protein